MAAIERGFIAHYDPMGWGFIRPDSAMGRDNDIYFHAKITSGEPAHGKRAAFSVEPDPKRHGKLRASRVAILNDDE
jgi:cold shock CspA family protein